MEMNHRWYAGVARCAAIGSAGLGLLFCAGAQAQGGGSWGGWGGGGRSGCTPGWSDQLAYCGLHRSTAMGVLDLGTGPAIYSSARTFSWHAGGLQICRAGDERWEQYTGLIPAGDEVVALTQFEAAPGTGQRLVAVTRQSSPHESSVWMWDGVQWDQIAHTPQHLWSAAVFDDGSGPALYIGGAFCQLNNDAICRLARWRGEGHGWEQVAPVLSSAGTSSISVLAVLDDGGGAALYAGGRFDSIGGTAANNIARWDGQNWAALGDGVPVENWFRPIRTIAMHDDGSGRAVYIGGEFVLPSGGTGGMVWRWDGGQWAAAGEPLGTQPVAALVSGEVAGQPRLYVMGSNEPVAEWDGSGWATVLGAGGASEHAHARVGAVFDDGSGGVLRVGGSIDSGAVWTPGVALWDGQQWRADRTGLTGSASWPPSVMMIRGAEFGGERQLIVSGEFDGFDDLRSMGSVMWDGEKWHSAGPRLNAVAVFDSGSGGELYGGTSQCLSSGAGFCNAFGRWDGEMWVPVGGEVMVRPVDMAVWDDGSGDGLYMISAPSSGGPSGRDLLRWDGTALTMVSEAPGLVRRLAVYDDGSGKALYAAGRNLWRWDGSAWDIVGGGLYGTLGSHVGPDVFAMEVIADGAGEALYITGEFERVGGAAGPVARGVARWDGEWTVFGDGLPAAAGAGYALAMYDDGRGPALYIGSWPTSTVPAILHRWDGTQWEWISGIDQVVLALHAWDDGQGEALWAGGKFTTFAGVWSRQLARYEGCVCYANCDGSTAEPILNINDFMCFVNRFAEAKELPVEEQVVHYANCDGSTEPPVLTVNDFLCFMERFAAGCP